MIIDEMDNEPNNPKELKLCCARARELLMNFGKGVAK